MDFLLAQAVPPVVPSAPTEWWVPLIAAVLVALWDIVKRKFNLVDPIAPAPNPEPVPPVVPQPVPPAPAPSPTPIIDIVKQLLPLLIPLLVPAIKAAMKDEAK